MNSNKSKSNNLPVIIGGIIGAVALVAVLFFSGVLGAASYNNFPVARINGLEISYREVSANLLHAESNLFWDHFEIFPDFEVDHSIEVEPGVTFGDLVIEEAVRLAAFNVLYEDEARRLGVTVSRAELDMIDNDITGLIIQWGREGFSEALREERIQGRSHLNDILVSNQLFSNLIVHILDNDAEFARFESYMPEDSVEVARELATELLDRARSGENFDDLIMMYGEDPGMWDNPEGYSFTTGVMVPEFEEATRDLAIGEISDLVQSGFGFHIIMRVEPDLDNVMGDLEDEDVLGAKHILIGFDDMHIDDRRVAAIVTGLETMVEEGSIELLPEIGQITF